MFCLENSDINLLIEWLEWRSFWVFKKTVAFYIIESMTDTYRISLYLVYPNVNIVDTILLLPSCIGVQGFHDQDQYHHVGELLISSLQKWFWLLRYLLRVVVLGEAVVPHDRVNTNKIFKLENHILICASCVIIVARSSLTFLWNISLDCVMAKDFSHCET